MAKQPLPDDPDEAPYDPFPYDETEYKSYEEGSWDQWDYTVTGHRCKTYNEDRGAYLPSPMEIRNRCAMLNWLQLHGFRKRMIYAVMQFDHPGFGLVQRMVKRHGMPEAEMILNQFLPEVEYDEVEEDDE